MMKLHNTENHRNAAASGAFCGEIKEMKMEQPKTLDEARNTNYGKWTWHVPYNPNLCAYRLRWPPYFGAQSCQCTNKKGYGNGELFCKQHAR